MNGKESHNPIRKWMEEVYPRLYEEARLAELQRIGDTNTEHVVVEFSFTKTFSLPIPVAHTVSARDPSKEAQRKADEKVERRLRWWDK